MHYLIGVTSEINDDKWQHTELDGGRYLVFDAEGPVPESIKKAMQQINKDILPNLEYEIRHAPFFELYKDGPIREDNYVTEIWLPIV